MYDKDNLYHFNGKLIYLTIPREYGNEIFMVTSIYPDDKYNAIKSIESYHHSIDEAKEEICNVLSSMHNVNMRQLDGIKYFFYDDYQLNALFMALDKNSDDLVVADALKQVISFKIKNINLYNSSLIHTKIVNGMMFSIVKLSNTMLYDLTFNRLSQCLVKSYSDGNMPKGFEIKIKEHDFRVYKIITYSVYGKYIDVSFQLLNIRDHAILVKAFTDINYTDALVRREIEFTDINVSDYILNKGKFFF